MNQGNNNYNQFNQNNQNFNNQPNNMPTQPVKNKFFNFDLDNSNNRNTDFNVSNNVGATTSKGTSNVISWGVGKKTPNSFNNQQNNFNQENVPEKLDIFGINQVNSDVFNGNNVEILDEFQSNDNQQQSYNNEVLDLPKYNDNYMNNLMSNQIQNSNSNFMNQQNNMNQFNNTNMPVSPIFQESNQSMMQRIPDSMSLPQQSRGNNMESQNMGWQDGLGTTNPQGQDWMNNQPLSATSLGGTSMNSESQPKDVVEQSRFFNANINNQVQNNQENAAQFAMHYGNGVGVVLNDPPPIFDEMSALKQFVGNDFTKLSMSIFSFSTFLFGSLIFLHRKMYVLGIILTFIEVGISYFVPLKFAIVAILILHIVLALMINPIYIKSAKKKVITILNDKNNMKMNQVEIENLCRKKGKNNLFVAIVIYMLCSGLLFMISSTTNISESIKKGINFVINNGENEKDSKEEQEKKLKIEDYINVTIPSEFTKDDKNIYSYSYVTGNSKETSSCEISIDRLKNVDDAEAYIEKLRNKYNIKESVGMTTINGITWYTISNRNDNGQIYYRVGQVSDIFLILEYKIGPRAQDDVCVMNYSTIVSSIEIKKSEEEN